MEEVFMINLLTGYDGTNVIPYSLNMELPRLLVGAEIIYGIERNISTQKVYIGYDEIWVDDLINEIDMKIHLRENKTAFRHERLTKGRLLEYKKRGIDGSVRLFTGKSAILKKGDLVCSSKEELFEYISILQNQTKKYTQM